MGDAPQLRQARDELLGLPLQAPAEGWGLAAPLIRLDLDETHAQGLSFAAEGTERRVEACMQRTDQNPAARGAESTKAGAKRRPPSPTGASSNSA